MGWVVKFHADGGQMCVPGLRDFGDDKDAAHRFANKMRDEPRHVCEREANDIGKSTVIVEYSEEKTKERGIIYPLLNTWEPEDSRGEIHLDRLPQSCKFHINSLLEIIPKSKFFD